MTPDRRSLGLGEFTRFSAAYFFLFAYLGGLAPYLTQWMMKGRFEASVGGASQVIALLMASGPIAGMVAARLSDRYGVRSRLFRGLGVLAAVMPFLWLYAPPALLFLYPILQGIALSPQVTLLDATTLDALETRRHLYGRIRVAGTIGFGVGYTISGYAMSFGVDHILWATLVFGVGFLLSTLLVPNSQTAEDAQERRRPARELWSLCGYRLFLLGTVLHGFAFAHFEAFGVPHMLAHGVPHGWNGLVVAVGLACETVIILLAPRLIARSGSKVHRLIGLAIAAAALRWALVPSLHGVLSFSVVQSLHALSFGLWFVASLHALSQAIPRRLRTTGQAFFVAAFAVGQASGARFAGWGRETIGPGPTFYADAAIALCAMVIVWSAARRLASNQLPSVAAGPPAR